MNLEDKLRSMGYGSSEGRAPATTTEPPVQSQPEAPTGGETEQGPGIFDRIKEIGSRAVDLAPALVYSANQAVNPLTMFVDKAEEPVSGRADAAARKAMDSATVGNLDFLAEGKAQADALVSGQGVDKAIQAGNEAKQNVNTGLLEASEEYPVTSTVAAIGGSFAPGSLFFRAATKAGMAGTRAVMAAAGSEAGIYTINSDGSLSEAAINAGTGAVLGGAAKKVFDLGGGVLTSFYGKSRQRINQELGEQLIAGIRSRNPDMSVADALKMVDELPEGKLLTDLYPGLRNRVKELAQSPDPVVQSRAVDLVRTRNYLSDGGAAEEIRKVIAGDDLMTPTQFQTYINNARKTLSPQYTRLFDGLEEAGVRVDMTGAKGAIKDLMDDSLTSFCCIEV